MPCGCLRGNRHGSDDCVHRAMEQLQVGGNEAEPDAAAGTVPTRKASSPTGLVWREDETVLGCDERAANGCGVQRAGGRGREDGTGDVPRQRVIGAVGGALVAAKSAK
ncbi:hypothetical protein FGB62_170g10 [Gracilaria domingensis]|nr:hypothetical protein FGB62_170g10 [Gracilaria domingensis]